MKKIGLVGGTGPESTVIYYRELNKRIEKITDGTEFPEISIESVNLYKALTLVAELKYDELEKYLTSAIDHLIASGVDMVALTAGTMHVIFDRLSDKFTIPLISIPETVAETAVKCGYKKIGLLGTIFTMEKDYLSKAFIDRGIEIVVPSCDDRETVNKIISKELEHGIVNENSRSILIKIIEKMCKETGIQAVILGCTELPLALNQNNCPVDCLDIMEIHIDKLVKMITE